MSQKINTLQEEWLKVLTKGMITIPKVWRQTLGLKEGDLVRARRIADQLIIEPIEKKAPYRIYTQKELQQFLKDDRLTQKLSKKIEKKLKRK